MRSRLSFTGETKNYIGNSKGVNDQSWRSLRTLDAPLNWLLSNALDRNSKKNFGLEALVKPPYTVISPCVVISLHFQVFFP